MVVNLLTLGQDEFGKVGTVSLASLNASDAETRSYSGTGYKRVSRFEIFDGNAPAPSAGTVTLSTYDGYDQWDAARSAGDEFNTTSITDTSVNFAWSRPSGYTAFPQAEVRQAIYCVECATQTLAGCEADTFLDGTVKWSGDGSSASGVSFTCEKWYLCGIVMEWDDEGVATWPQQSNSYPTRVAGVQNGGIADSGGDGPAIIFEMDTCCVANGNPCPNATCPTDAGCCSGWCDEFNCVATEPELC
jgi:hypothetical protein